MRNSSTEASRENIKPVSISSWKPDCVFYFKMGDFLQIINNSYL